MKDVTLLADVSRAAAAATAKLAADAADRARGNSSTDDLPPESQSLEV